MWWVQVQGDLGGGSIKMCDVVEGKRRCDMQEIPHFRQAATVPSYIVHYTRAQFSPVGRKLAFIAARVASMGSVDIADHMVTEMGLFVADFDENSVERVEVPQDCLGGVAWHPSGERLVYAGRAATEGFCQRGDFLFYVQGSAQDVEHELYLVNLTRSPMEAIPLTDLPNSTSRLGPAWYAPLQLVPSTMQ